MATRRQMALAMLATGSGSHAASWLHPSTDPRGSIDIAYYRRIAQLAEQGKFDLFFIADTPAARTEMLQGFARYPTYMNEFEPITLLANLAAATDHIGLGGTVSTSFSEPYNVARQFASLDHLSGGRAAWNVVTSANDFAARNFGHAKMAPHSERYARAREFVGVVDQLWDSWDDDAFIRDRSRGLFFDPSKQHAVHHCGPNFTVNGALNIERSPQGKPIIIQAGASDTGKELAAETAEVVFASSPTLEKAAASYTDLKGRMAKYGRDWDSLKVLAGLPVIVGETDEAARAYQTELQSLIHPDVARLRLSMDFESDLTDLPMDQPIPEDRIPKSANLHKMYFDHILEMIRVEKLTLGEIAMRYQRAHTTLCGSVNTVADHMQSWLEGGACDGFMLIFPTLPNGLETFVAQVVPELQRRGIFRTEYAGPTLRDNLGIGRPAVRYPAQGHAAE